MPEQKEQASSRKQICRKKHRKERDWTTSESSSSSSSSSYVKGIIQKVFQTRKIGNGCIFENRNDVKQTVIR